ncbi:MAG TPA: sulfatase-like hydrolase/transferase [Sedimentisphaerales bacterium]|nr:sulfatase-like hydrolase/transferase [Sedimentisphaerales bacterium]
MIGKTDMKLPVGTRRDFLKATGLAAASLLVPACVSASKRWAGQAPSGKPNIVLIMADDLGYECLSCYGSLSYKTPVLDQLARTGMRFDNCHSQPLCTPSRVKIMTGRYNSRNYTTFGNFDFNEKTFAHVLKSVGYATCIAGKWQLMGRGAAGPYDAGFDEYCLWHMEDAFGPKECRYRSPKIIKNGRLVEGLEGKYGPDAFCDYILDYIERHKSGPFLVYYPMTLVHGAFVPTPDSPDWAQPVHKSDTKYFADMVAYMDKIVGRILRKLDELGLRENTLILFTGDNGTAKKITSKMPGRTIKGGKSLTIDTGTHVPLIANWKGATPAGRVCDDLVDFSDFLPTLAEAGGAALPENVIIDGRSFLPQLRGEKGNPREWLFCHYAPQSGQSFKRFVRDKRWKLYQTGELFDVQADPLEESPIGAGEGGEQAAAARRRFQAVLDSVG